MAVRLCIGRWAVDCTHVNVYITLDSLAEYSLSDKGHVGYNAD